VRRVSGDGSGSVQGGGCRSETALTQVVFRCTARSGHASGARAEDQLLELIGRDRFRQVMVESGLFRAALVLGLTPARHCDEQCAPSPRRLPNALRQAIAIEVREADIEDCRMGSEGGSEIEGLAAGVGSLDVMSGGLEQRSTGIRRVTVVIDHQNPQSDGRSAARAAIERCRLEVELAYG